MMATISPWSNVTRQPFGVLDGERLRALTLVKNTQNAIFTTPTTSLKRRHEAPNFDEVDTENVDPATLASPTKKHKAGLLETSEPTTTEIVKSLLARQIRSPRRSDVKSTRWQGIILGQTPTTPVNSTPSPTQVVSAPAAAGRSPKSKRVGILSRRRMTATPFTRVNPPSFTSNGIHGGMPSIDAALSGTAPSRPHPTRKVKPEDFCTLEESKPKGWVFDVYEESETMQLETVVFNSASHLDISDDESAAKMKADIGKENIPPPNDFLSASVLEVPSSASRNHILDEPRTPLGDLEASQFYAEGCDGSSHFLVPEEESAEKDGDKLFIEPAKVQFASAPVVEIWDSESAKLAGVFDEEEL